MLSAVAATGRDYTCWEVITMLKKIIGWAIVIFIVYYLATDPHGAAHFVHGVFTWLQGAGRSLATFVNDL